MSKEEFLSILDRKLELINEKERRDIIDEYRTHIEMKVQDGKTEAEAIEDFGDIDELVDEILDAYKINTSKANQSFDRKFNHFMDDLYDGFKRFIGSFTSLEVDDVVKLIFEVIVILFILAILHIPFSIISSLGSSLLSNVVGFGIGHVLAGIWRIVIELAYVVVFIVVIVNVVMKRVNRYRRPADYDDHSTVFDDFKQTFHSYNRRTSAFTHENTSKKEEDLKQDFYENNTEDETFHENMNEDMDETGQTEKEAQRARRGYETRDDRMRHTERTDVGESVTSVLRVLMRIFYCLLAIPFIGVIIGLSCAIGAMVVFSIQGFTLVGAYFLVIGALFVTGAFMSLLHSVLWRKG